VSLVKNALLASLQNLVGITPIGAPVVLDDGNISLTLPLVPDIARRSQASGPSGWYQGRLQNVHSAADAEVSTIDPYNPGASALGSYPPAVVAGFDVWLVGCSLVQSSGVAGITEGTVTLELSGAGANLTGWGQDDAGSVVTGFSQFNVARFSDIIATITAGGSDFGVTPSGDPMVYPKLRIPRGGRIRFRSESPAAATYLAVLLLGLFPEGLGQDIVA